MGLHEADGAITWASIGCSVFLRASFIVVTGARGGYALVHVLLWNYFQLDRWHCLLQYAAVIHNEQYFFHPSGSVLLQ